MLPETVTFNKFKLMLNEAFDVGYAFFGFLAVVSTGEFVIFSYQLLHALVAN